MTEPSSIGEHLRAARRKRRMGIDRAAEETRIRPDFLMRMESDEFDFLAPAYVRGFLRSYARSLGLDPAPLLEQFDRRYGSARADTSHIVALGERTRSPRRRVPRERRSSSSKWTVAAALAASALLVLGGIGLLSPAERGDGDNVASDNNSVPDESPKDKEPPRDRKKENPRSQATLAFAEGIELEVVASTAACWMDITDGAGNVLYNGTLQVGQGTTVSSDDEMTIVLGYPAGVELIVNGRNLGSPGGADPVTLHLPDDVDAI